jgi:16S rRNA (uracil1498-N3)-methyltransferase
VNVDFAAAFVATAHVFVESLDDVIVIDGADGRHLSRVRRVAAGELLTAADGSGRWRPYEATVVSKTGIRAESREDARLEPRLTPSLEVAFAVTKGAKPELVVQKLTELGVDVIVPVVTRRSVVRWDEQRAEAATARFERIAREAAMQSRRARVPIVRNVARLGDLVGRADLVVADRAGRTLRELESDGRDAWCLVVGPEGGFDDDELVSLAKAARLAVGPHVLRAETAAIAVAAALTAVRSPCQ